MLATYLVTAVLVAVSFLFARIARHAGFPPAASIVLVGIAAGDMFPHALQVGLTPATLAVFLPALIFEGAWDLDAGALRRVAVPIAVLAVPGVVFTALAIAAGGVFGGLSLVAALALGAILSATDPVAVIALFRSLKIPVDLATIVEGESIANDGVAVVLVQLILAVAATHAPPAPWAALGRVAYVSLAGILIGVLGAALGAPVLRRRSATWIGIVVTTVVAYGAYGAAAAIDASGIFASAAAGVALPAFALAKRDERGIERFWDATALVANGAVFLLVGLNVRFDRIFHEPLLIVATFAAVLLSRAALAYVLVRLPRTGSLPAWRHVIGLAGLRGGLSLALALGLPHDFPNRSQVLDAVFAIVVTTIVVQGWALGPILRRIPLRAA